MIRTVNLNKSFGGFKALKSVSIHAPKGSVYGLVGPNGAGKSTLIRHLCGVYLQDAGEVRIGGEHVYENVAAKRRIATIPDSVYYFPQADIRAMKRFYASIYPAFDAERFEKLRGAFTLNERKPIRRMSRGMQKQAAFWLAVCQGADVIILDEPVDGLDPVMRRQVWSILMSDVAERGTTVLVSSHNLRELEDVCDHIGILHGGELLLERSLESLQSGVIKLQMAFQEEVKIPEGLDILHSSKTGRVQTLILRGEKDAAIERFTALSPIFMEAIPLTLEEIFIYELGGHGYAAKEILL